MACRSRLSPCISKNIFKTSEEGGFMALHSLELLASFVPHALACVFQSPLFFDPFRHWVTLPSTSMACASTNSLSLMVGARARLEKPPDCAPARILPLALPGTYPLRSRRSKT